MAQLIVSQIDHTPKDNIAILENISSHTVGGNEVNCGYYSSSYYGYCAEVLFRNITIPKGATILTCVLTLTCRTEFAGTGVKTLLKFEDADTGVLSTSWADYLAKSWTTGTAWDISDVWTVGNDYDSNDFASDLQTIVDRAGWASGNNLNFYWDDNGSSGNNSLRRAQSYAGDNAHPPTLTITYSTGAQKHKGLFNLGFILE